MSKLLTLAIILALSVSFCLADQTSRNSSKVWTVLVYISGDNNLAEAGLDDINEMESIGSTEFVNIVVQIDGSVKYTPLATETRRYFITKDDDISNITSAVLGDKFEADMGDPETLESFLEWGVENYPAEKYAFIIWNHGNGWYPDDGLHRMKNPSKGPVDPLKAISSDDSSGNCISTADIGKVAYNVSQKIGKPIDLIGFDACLMGMVETHYGLRNAARVACGSEKTEPGDGWPYDEWLAILTSHPEFEAEDLGRTIVETYAGSYNGGTQGTSNVTQSAIRLDASTVSNLEAAIDLFADELIAQLDDKRDAVKAAISKTQDFRVRSWFGSYFTTHRDLYDFAEKIKDELPEAEDLCTSADLVIEAIEGENGFVIANGITDVSQYGSVKAAHGVAIYLPSDGFETIYKELDFAKNTHWFDFINKLTMGKVIEATDDKARPSSKELLFSNLYGE